MIFILFGGMALLVIVANYIYGHSWSRNLQVRIWFEDHYIVEGGRSALKEEIINHKKLPVPMLQVAFQTGRFLNFDDRSNLTVTDQSYKRDIFSVSADQKIIRTLPFQCRRRGYYEVKSADLKTRALFGRQNYLEVCAQQTDMYVYPAGAAVDQLDLLRKKFSGTAVSRQFLYEDPFELRGIREYMPEDGMGKINWKATARAGSFMVNVCDATISREVVILLDVEDETTWKYEQLHEESIRIAASVTGQFLEDGLPVRISCNGKDQLLKERVRVPAGTGRQQMHSIFQCMARIDLSQQPERFEHILTEEKKRSVRNTYYMIISKNQRPGLAAEVRELLAEGAGGLWILPLYHDMELKLPDMPGIDIHRWEVKQK